MSINMMKSIVVTALLLGMPLAQATPDIEHWQTSRGIDVYFVQADELPMVDVQLVFDAGSARDGDQPGLANLTLSLLDDGAAGMSGDEISTAFESVGARFGVSLDQDTARLTLRSLTEPKPLATALDMLRKVMSQPDFPERDVARERQRTLTGIQARWQSPGAVAADAFFKALYGEHPYGHPKAGTEASVEALTRADLVGFYQRHYHSANVMIAIVGALPRSEAEQLAEDITADLPAGEPLPALPAVEPTDAQQVTISFPSAQTHILLGTPLLQRDDPDYFPLYVGNHVLGGGGMVSRLFETIREDRGLSYSVYSYMMPLQQPGPFVAGLQTSTEQAEAALGLLREQIELFIANGPNEAELQSSIQNITGGFPLRIDSNSSIIGYLAMLGFYDLPLDYLDTFNARVEAVTAEQIVAAFQRRLSLDDFATVLVGRENE